MAQVVCVTGSSGFIGQYVTRQLLARGDYVVGIDAETYCADLDSIPTHGRFQYLVEDIARLDRLPDCDAVIHLAAETHVDNSIMDPARFMQTNVLGTFHLLELIRAKRNYQMPLLIHISTDEVYGDTEGEKTDTSPLRPSSPYAASKAAADHLVQAWGRTHHLKYRIVRPSNCYGFGQFPEKLIPKAVRHLGLGRKIPIHGDGSQTRSWLAVEDCASAILTVLDKGYDNGVFNISGNTRASVREVVGSVVSAYYSTALWGLDPYVEFEATRNGLDAQYAVCDAPLRALGWEPTGSLWSDLGGIVEAERASWRW